MQYPILLLRNTQHIYPLFGSQVSGEPYLLNFSSDNPNAKNYDPAHFEPFQEAVFGELSRSGKKWAIGRYLEERATLLRHYPQMITEKRYFHTGVDLVVPEGTRLYAPLTGTVYLCGRDEGLGNYGGYVAFRHAIDGCVFYTFYGHLRTPHQVTVGQVIEAGSQFATIGGAADSGGWFTHTHLQVVTDKAEREDKMTLGYITAADVLRAEELFPNPYLLVRYEG